MRPMLAYLAACGMGLGHAGRMLSVAKRLKSCGVEVVFSSYGRAVEMIRANGYPCLKTREVSYEVDEHGDVDVRRTVAKGPANLYRFARQVGDELYYIGTLAPDVVLSDSRLSTLIAAKARMVPVVLVLSQLRVVIPVKRPTSGKVKAKGLAEEALYRLLGRCWYTADAVMIPDYPPPYTIAKANILAEGEKLPPRVRFVGPVLPAWPEELPPKEEAKKRLGIRGRLVVASFTGVGDEGRALLEYFIGEVKGCTIPSDVRIIISRGNPSGSPALEKLGRGVYVCDWLPERTMYVKAADALVTHGGHTTVMEAIAFGLPAVHLVKKTHTERLGNSLSAEALGVARTHVVDEDAGTLCEKILWALSDEAQEAASRLSNELIRYKGDYEVVREALKLANHA